MLSAFGEDGNESKAMAACSLQDAEVVVFAPPRPAEAAAVPVASPDSRAAGSAKPSTLKKSPSALGGKKKGGAPKRASSPRGASRKRAGSPGRQKPPSRANSPRGQRPAAAKPKPKPPVEPVVEAAVEALAVAPAEAGAGEAAPLQPFERIGGETEVYERGVYAWSMVPADGELEKSNHALLAALVKRLK